MRKNKRKIKGKIAPIKSIGDYFLLLVSMVALFFTYFIWQPYNKCMIQTGDSDMALR